MNKYFVLLGGNMLLRGVFDKLKSYGYSVIVIDWNEFPAIEGDLHFQVDVKDTKTVLSVLECGNYDIDGAISCIDLAVPTVNAINLRYGLKVMPDKFNMVLSKAQMREDWERAGIFNRISKSSKDINIEYIIGLNKEYKLIIKPDIAASSRGITILEKCSLKSEILSAIEKAQEISFDSDFIVEEFVEGQEFTVDMLGDDFDNVVVYGISVKYHSKNALNNRVAVKLHWNSNAYPDNVYELIAQRGKECYKAIGLKNSFGHLELIMKPDGTLTPVEIGARSSGFIASHLVSAASQKDYLADYISMLHGGNIGNVDHINGCQSTMWFGYDIPKGYKAISDVNLSKYLNSKIGVMYSNRDGLVINKLYKAIIDDNGRDHTGYEMLVGAKDVLTIEAIKKAELNFLRDFCNYGKEQVDFVFFDEKYLLKSWNWLNDDEIRKKVNLKYISKSESLKWFASLGSKNDYLIWGISFGATPIGACGLKNIVKEEEGEFWGYIGEKEFWGIGIGMKMLRFIEKKAMEMRLKRIVLKVQKDNVRAIRLYEKGEYVLEREVNNSFVYSKAL